MKQDETFDPRATVKKLLRESRSGALATLMPGTGDPYCSLVNVATDAAGAPLLLISGLAIHTRNITTDSRVSLMLDERKEGDPLQGARVMLMGRASRTDSPEARRRYLARQPEADMFVDFPDFGFYRIDISAAHLVAGFGRIVSLEPGDILTDVTGAEALLAAESDAAAHMNEDHTDALALYATVLLNAPAGEWRCAGCDPEGLELQNGRVALRLPFPQRVTSPGALRNILRQLAEEARARSGT